MDWSCVSKNNAQNHTTELANREGASLRAALLTSIPHTEPLSSCSFIPKEWNQHGLVTEHGSNACTFARTLGRAQLITEHREDVQSSWVAIKRGHSPPHPSCCVPYSISGHNTVCG